MPTKVLEVTYRGRDEFSKVAKEAGLNADQAARKFREMNDAAKGGKGGSNGEDDSGGGLKGVANALGSRRLLSRIVSGGIAGFVGSELNQFIEKAAELADEFHRGQIDATGMVVKIGEGLPIIGGFVS